mmetsp:Transcript_55850/g.93004  ORF Transcript_55850/g.93004 Transcript_55850/m.93004 type:complete len:505 (-) Transcript_55850:48-1562(-)|eukprot:CAMPEP_0202688846 /NCGR_PEP_ID=MMETSP1385-20130828/4252_1 /ASSEMBLY_ACC=CAM_ASM_000861 /TAXON_ID=933848 /ORGANISM="Elphidium margaritaceum" /LENGTH=504 /DNA_ID=CAMNT_0049343897 /DNA_START=305 /DNA_END=1819 /DNA_ORIENTATION=+
MSVNSKKKSKSHFLKNLRDKVRGRNEPKPNGAKLKDKKQTKAEPKPTPTASSLASMDRSGPPQLDELLEQLPPIREAKEVEDKRRLFIQKLRLCCYSFDFKHEAQKKEAEARENKRRMLVELIDHLSSSKAWVSEESLRAILQMIAANLFRPLPPSLYKDFDPDEDEPTHDPAWVHLQFVYEFLLRFIVSNNTDAKMLKKFIDRKFLLSVIDLFQSEDPRERDYLKTILHRIYGKFMSFRSFLRRAINNIFFQVIYGIQKHNGLAELLEILGSIINGFATPLKDEHQRFLRSVLIPLHKVEALSQYHAQLAYCVVQFIEKEPHLSKAVVAGLLRYWPIISCSKELLFLSELEEVLEMTEQTQFVTMIEPVFKRIAACICSAHFQVAERALFLWNNDVIAAFMSDHRPVILPILYPALHTNLEQHWNSTVTQLTQHIMQQFMDMDEKLYKQVEQNYKEHHKPLEKAQQRRLRWSTVQQQSEKNGAASSSSQTYRNGHVTNGALDA